MTNGFFGRLARKPWLLMSVTGIVFLSVGMLIGKSVPTGGLSGAALDDKVTVKLQGYVMNSRGAMGGVSVRGQSYDTSLQRTATDDRGRFELIINDNIPKNWGNRVVIQMDVIMP